MPKVRIDACAPLTLVRMAAFSCVGCCVQPVVVDARGHMLGRLASILAKQLLTGQYLVRRELCKDASAFVGLPPPIATVPFGRSLTKERQHYQRASKVCISLPSVAHMLSRRGQVVVRCEEITISGGLVRQKAKYERFLKKRMLTAPQKGPIHYRAPSRILWRTLRGCGRVFRLPAGCDDRWRLSRRLLWCFPLSVFCPFVVCPEHRWIMGRTGAYSGV